MELKRNLRVYYHRKLKDQDYLIRMAIVIGFVTLMTIFIPRSVRHEYRHEVGQQWVRQDLIAEADFMVMKDPDTLAMERDRVASTINPILARDTVAVGRMLANWDSSIVRFTDQLEIVRKVENDSSDTFEEASTYFLNEIGQSPQALPEGFAWITGVKQQVVFLITRLDRKGLVLNLPVSESSEFLSVKMGAREEWEIPRTSLLKSERELAAWLIEQLEKDSEQMAGLVQRMLRKVIEPTLVYDELLTNQARTGKMRWVSPAKHQISRGERIVRKGDVITPQASERIRAYSQLIRTQGGVDPSTGMVVGRFLLIFLITMLMLTFLRVNRPTIYFSNQRLALVLSTILLVVGAMVVATKLNDLALNLFGQERSDLNLPYIFLAPACIVPIFMSNFFDHRVAFFANLVIAFSGAVLVQVGLEYAFVQLIAGTVAVYSLRRLRKREVFFYTLGFIFLGYTIAYVTFNLFAKGNLDAVNFNTLMLFGINVLLTVIAYNLIYLFEQVFRVTSDLTYLELLDTNHPLLKELAKKAPGTFQHSLQVANIAEAVVNEIGGNALLIHVGALYHDIGKMAHPKYFIENKADGGGKEAPHEKLSCVESAEMIIGHVKKGVSIAQKYHLPKELIDFIQTHHGTTRVEFFYRKFLKLEGCKAPEGEDLFKYPGPLPFSKETAILMLADSVEAASRSMKKPTIELLEDLVDKIIDYKISEDQLVNSPLTFRDISLAREVLKKQMGTIYHGRIEYPKEVV